jgi:F-type H+-transporting ATPase subunit gamma
MSSILVSRLKGALPKARTLFQVSSRGFATEQQIKRRLKTVGNIKKITKAMKMVAAAKLRSVQNQLDVVRNFQQGATDVWPEPNLKDPNAIQKNLLVVITSDRGLCGSINSQCSRQARRYLDEFIQAKKPIQSIMFGDKGKGAIERVYGKTFAVSISESYKSKVMSFKQAAMLADIINTTDFDKAEIIYNRFKNLLSFETMKDKLFSWKISGPLVGDTFSKYAIEDGGYSDTMKNFHEFRTAVRLYHCFQENATSEQSARMNAMGNSAKNAGEMQDALRLIYNRTRQAKITTELIEIISGATSAEAGKKKKN